MEIIVTITSTDTNTQLSTSDVRGKFSEGTGVTISSGEISIGQAVGTGDSVTFASVFSHCLVISLHTHLRMKD